MYCKQFSKQKMVDIHLLHVFVRLSYPFSFFFSVSDWKIWKNLFYRKNKWFWPANGVRSTRLLVEIHNNDLVLVDVIAHGYCALTTAPFHMFCWCWRPKETLATNEEKPLDWKCNGLNHWLSQLELLVSLNHLHKTMRCSAYTKATI